MIRILNSMLRSLISMAALVKREVIKMLILKNIPTYTMAAFINLRLKIFDTNLNFRYQ